MAHGPLVCVLFTEVKFNADFYYVICIKYLNHMMELLYEDIL